jgi:hypothetical protein
MGGEVEGALLLAVAVSCRLDRLAGGHESRYGGLVIGDLLTGAWQGKGTDYRAGGAAVRCGGSGGSGGRAGLLEAFLGVGVFSANSA